MRRLFERVSAARLALAAALAALFWWSLKRGQPAEPAGQLVEERGGMFRQSRVIRERGAEGHETRDLNPLAIAGFGCAFLIAMVVLLVIATGVFSLFTGQPPRVAAPPANLANAPTPVLPPAPQLEAVPGQNLQQFQETEAGVLNTYGWVDRNRGVVHIPISRAMQLIVSQNLPARPAADASKFKDNGNQIPSVSSSGRMMEPIAP